MHQVCQQQCFLQICITELLQFKYAMKQIEWFYISEQDICICSGALFALTAQYAQLVEAESEKQKGCMFSKTPDPRDATE